MTLRKIRFDGIWGSGGSWELLNANGEDVHEWPSLTPFVWVRLSCLLHGWGWPKVT